MARVPPKIPLKVRPGIQTRKFMFAMVWGTAGFHVVNLLKSQRNFDSDYLINDIMQPLVDRLFPQRMASRTSRFMVHLDSYWIDFSKGLQTFFNENSLRRITQSLYSPDLALSDFWLFGHMKIAL
jgi:hypothetical protein